MSGSFGWPRTMFPLAVSHPVEAREAQASDLERRFWIFPEEDLQ